METEFLQIVQGAGYSDLWINVSHTVDDVTKLLLTNHGVNEWVVSRQSIIEECTTKRGLNEQ